MKILVIRFSSIGDIVQTTSPLRSLKLIYPESEIHFLTLEPFRSLLAHHPDIHSLHTVEKEAGFSALRSLARNLNKNHYDLVIDFHHSLRSRVVRFFIKGPKRAVKKPRWKRFLYMYWHYNTFAEGYSYQDLLHYPLRNIISDNYYPATKLALGNTEQEWTVLKERFALSESFLALVPGAAWPNKQWPVAYYQLLIHDLVTRGDHLIILGGEKDHICDQIDTDHPLVINLKGKTSLRESLLILEKAQRVIGSDTGMVHAAEALGTPVMTILGPTTREMGAGIQLEQSLVLEDQTVWCRPCSQNGSRPCYRTKRHCLENITPEMAVRRLASLGA